MDGVTTVASDRPIPKPVSLLAVAVLASTFSIDSLSWLSGGWSGSMGKAKIEEYWTPAEGNTMLGVNRTIVDGKTVAFEFLRIEERADGIYYVAHPGARSGTEFKLTRMTESEAVFENPDHDHPKIIRYRRDGRDSMVAQIEGNPGGKHVVQDFRYQRTSQ